MTYSSEDYAKAAVKATENGQILKIVKGKFVFEDVKFSTQNTQSDNEIAIQQRINETNQKIAVLQDIVDFDMQESNEDEQLKAWKKYRILLTRIDVTQTNIVWPTKPE